MDEHRDPARHRPLYQPLGGFSSVDFSELKLIRSHDGTTFLWGRRPQGSYEVITWQATTRRTPPPPPPLWRREDPG
jgi:hypothetical protein